MIIDVRSHAERSEGFVCGSVHVPTPSPPLSFAQQAALSHALLQVMAHVPEDEEVYVYCRRGIRAGVAQQMLWNIGVNAISLGGTEEGPLPGLLQQRQLFWCVP